MKKTIIATLALSSIALGEQSITLTNSTSLTSSNTTFSWDADTYGTTFTSWEVTFDLNHKQNDDGSYVALADREIFSTYRNGGQTTGTILATNSNGTIDIYHFDDKTTNVYTSTAVLDNTKVMPITISFVAEYDLSDTYLGGTFTVQSGETEYLNFHVDKTWENTQMEKGYSSIWTQTGNCQFSNVKLKQLDDIRIIPEPTTATLSLLALAGLAARRRRK